MQSLAPFTPVNRVASQFQGVGAPSVQITYDGLVATDVQDRNGNITHTNFDALGRATQRCDPTSHCTQFRYDASGRLTSLTNRRGQRLDYAYDRLGRLLSKSGANTTTDAFAYSADSRGASASNAVETDSVRVVPGTSVRGGSDTTITRLHNTRFQVIHGDLTSVGARDSTIITAIGANLTFRPRYVNADPVTGMITTVNDGFNTTTYTYTGDWLQTAKSSASNENMFYLPTHELSSTSFSASNLTPLTREYHYDRVTRINQAFTGGSLSAAKSGSYYFYDSNGRLAQSQLRTGCTATAYDTLYQSGYRHEHCSTITTSGTYTYDAEGNRTSQGGTYGPGNRLQAFNGFTFQYDLDGNVVEKSNASTGADYQYAWSADNRLTDVTMRPNGSTAYTVVHFDYNAYGQPVLRTVGSVVSARVYDRGQLLLDLDASAGMQRVGEYEYIDGVDEPFVVLLGAAAPTSSAYIVQDALGNVVGTHDNSIVTMTASYDDWGTPTIGQSMVSRLLWKGLQWDEYAGLYNVRARWYDPAVGRFLSEDPAGFEGQANPYTFADGDPVGNRDPTGLHAEPLGFPNMPCWAACASQFFSITGASRELRRVQHPALTGLHPGKLASAPTEQGIEDRTNDLLDVILLAVPAAGELGTAAKELPDVGAGALRVIGHYPEYVELGTKLHAKIFNIEDREIWNALVRSGQDWAANQRFLDRGIRAGADFLLATERAAVREGSTLEREINYLLNHGYRWSDDMRRLIP